MTDVPTGTVNDVLSWVGDDPGRAQLALDAENESANPRTTLIAQLESIASEEAAVSDEPTTETTEDAPAPEQPVDVELYAGDAGVTILPVDVRDADVDSEGVDLHADPEADAADTLIDGMQVESVTGATAPNGAAISINGDVYLFNPQMVASLKKIVDTAVAGVTL